jgi:hypothetical protein
MVERCHAPLGEIVRDNAEPWVDLFSDQTDVSLGNPFGLFVVGLDDVMSAARMAGDRYPDGELLGFDRIATYEGTDLACVVEVERFRARVGNSSDLSPVSLRVTSVYRFEGSEWKLVHRFSHSVVTAASVVNRLLCCPANRLSVGARSAALPQHPDQQGRDRCAKAS